jgi:cyclopropane-fatty-acyl-phospholipid synthase
LRKGSSGLGDSYIKNEFETENLSSLIELGARNINVIYKFSDFFKLFFFKNFLDKNVFVNTRTRSKKNISLHYDLGNDFFSTWLDKTLTYSCGIFNSPNHSAKIYFFYFFLLY